QPGGEPVDRVTVLFGDDGLDRLGGLGQRRVCGEGGQVGGAGVDQGEDQVRGMRAGDRKLVEVDLPPDAGAGRGQQLAQQARAGGPTGECGGGAVLGEQFADLRVVGRVVEAAVLGEIAVAVDEVDLVRAALVRPDQFGDPDRDAGDDPAASVDRAWWGTHIGSPVPNW